MQMSLHFHCKVHAIEHLKKFKRSYVKLLISIAIDENLKQTEYQYRN